MRESQALSAEQVHRVELALSYLLRAGVIVATLLVLVGVGLMFRHHPEFASGGEKAKEAIAAMAFPHNIAQVLVGLKLMEGRAVVILGLFVLIATPVMRVAVSVLIFMHQRDRAFTWITLLVLALLLTSFLLGKADG